MSSISWEYPSTGPTPPSPGLGDASTELEYRFTPPLTSPRLHATIVVGDSCPPSPSGCSPVATEGHPTNPMIDRRYVTPNAFEEYAYPSPILTMIARATLDLGGHENRVVDPWTCDKPLEAFSLTGGHIPITGLEKNDEQTFDYYDLLSPTFPHECPISYCFSVNTIKALQQEIRDQWFAVYPQPIPPLIIRSNELVGAYNLNRRNNGCGYVVPTRDIWDTIRQRGVDFNYRPISPSITVDTEVCRMGTAQYAPQHVVASKFAVNIFLELPDSEGLSPLCEYLGAYVLQPVSGTTIWTDIEPEAWQSVPNRFSLGWPRLPYVHFDYYQWDHYFIRLANEFRHRYIVQRVPAPDETEAESVDPDNADSSSSNSTLDTDDSDSDTASTFSEPSSEWDWMSYLDFSSCE